MYKRFQRVISLGDGSGVQVFKAVTQVQLIEELAKAYESALKKIQKQSMLLDANRKFKFKK